jgi:hypothetical protein
LPIPSISAIIRDLSFTTGATNLDTAINISQTKSFASQIASGYTQNDISRVTFRSTEGYWQENAGSPVTIVHGWLQGIYTLNVSNIVFDTIVGYGPTPGGSGYAASTGSGSGIVIDGNNANLIPVVFNVVNSQFDWLSNGILLGNNVQGVQVSLSNFVGCYSGIGVSAGKTGLSELEISTSQFNNLFSISLSSVVPSLNIANNDFYAHQQAMASSIRARR